MAPSLRPRQRTTRTRARATAVTVGSFAASLAYLLGAYMVVFQAKIGPVVSSFDEAGGHGVHSGDILAIPLLALAAVMFVSGVLACDDATKPRTGTPWRVSIA